MKALCMLMTLQLFGPVQHEGALKAPPGPEWILPGSALTASTKLVRFDYLAGMRFVEARAIIVWQPRSPESGFQLVAADDGPVNVEVLAELPRSGGQGNPTVSKFDVTREFERLRRQGQAKQIGYRLRSTPREPAERSAEAWRELSTTWPVVYEVRLEAVLCGQP